MDILTKMHPHRAPEAIASIGLDALESGDMVVDLKLREKVLSGELPERVWRWYLITEQRDMRRIAEAKGFKTSWHAVGGPGGHASGRATRLSPPRLLRMHRIGNLRHQPFIVDYPTEVP